LIDRTLTDYITFSPHPHISHAEHMLDKTRYMNQVTQLTPTDCAS